MHDGGMNNLAKATTVPGPVAQSQALDQNRSDDMNQSIDKLEKLDNKL